MMNFDPVIAWPSGPMGLLIKATYHADPNFAAQQWDRWQDATTLPDDPDWQMTRVLVQAATGLSKRMSPEMLAAIRTASRHLEWTNFEHHLRNIRPMLSALSQSGIPVILTKGGAIVMSGIAAASSRLMADLDILIRPTQIDTVMDVVEGVGWKSKWPLSRPQFRNCLMSSRHSVPLSNDQKWEVDLHTSALLLNRCPDHDAPLWERSTTARSGDVTVLVPGVTDMLVITLAHGLLANRTTMGIWVGDAIALIESGRVDWGLFLEEVDRRDLHAFAYTCLTYLHQVLARPILGHVLSSLASSLRQPFPGELQGHIIAPHATSREIRASWGAAAAIRARKWRARTFATSPASRVKPASCPNGTTWQTARNSGATRYNVLVPEEMLHTDGQLILEVKLLGDATQSPDRLSVALICFDQHVCELDQVEVVKQEPTGDGQQSYPSVRLGVDPAIIDAYSLRQLRLELLKPGTLDPSTIKPDAVDYRWCT